VIGYRYFLELNEADMAEALEVPRGTVKSRLSRALDRLRTVLREQEGLVEAEGGGDA
jgi:RNA polymerase sigma-70 factor (ECF subfamily)